MIQWLKKLLGKGPPQDRQPTSATQGATAKTLIWGVIDGPYFAYEVWQDELLDDDSCLLVCKVEQDGEIFDSEVWFDCFDSAYEFKKYFDTNIEPLEITHGG